MKALSIELKIILFTLASHLFYSNSELLIAAKECAQNGITTFDKVVLTAFALSYSVMTTVSVFALRKLFPVLVFAVLDGWAVYLRINIDQQNFVLISAVFYGFYTAYIIVIAFMLKNLKPLKPTTETPSAESSVPAEKPAAKRRSQAAPKKQLPPQPVETISTAAIEKNRVVNQLTLF
ncbi:MAG: hypothetical protein K5685_13700 [Bacteroidales bacterium]|nr:hypothetical protein [Bacteroidales bacterium]